MHAGPWVNATTIYSLMHSADKTKVPCVRTLQRIPATGGLPCMLNYFCAASIRSARAALVWMALRTYYIMHAC